MGTFESGGGPSDILGVDRFFDLSPDLFAVIGADGRLLKANHAWESILGYTLGDLIGELSKGFVHPDDYQSTVGARQSVADGTRVVHFVNRLRTRAGGWRWIDWSAQGLEGSVYAVGKDITERMQMEEKLRQSEQRYHSLFSDLLEGVAVQEIVRDEHGTAVDYRIIDINPAFERLTGLKRDHVAGKLATEVYDIKDLPNLPKYLETAETGVPSRFQAYLPALNRYFDISVLSSKWDTFTTIFSDFTDIKNAQDELREARDRLQLQLERLPVACIVWSPTLRIVYWNPMAERVFGFTERELARRPLEELPFIPAAARPRVKDQIIRLLESDTIARAEGEGITRDARTIQCLWTNNSLVEGGHIVGVLSLVQDITEKAEAERGFRLHEKRLEGLVRLSQLRPRAAEDILEYALADAASLTKSAAGCAVRYDQDRAELGSPLWSKGTSVELKKKYEPLRAALTGETIRSLRPIIHNGVGQARGADHVDRLLSIPLTVKGKIVCVAAVAGKTADYTLLDLQEFSLLLDSVWRMVSLIETEEALRKTEEQLRQSQKMESIGRLAGGIAHDFNNLLQIIRGYADLLYEEIDEGHKEDVNQIRQTADKAARTVSQLLAFSRKSMLQMSLLDLNALVSRVERMRGRAIGEDIALACKTAPGLWMIRADGNQVENAVMNIIANARDAMPNGGRLVIETGNEVVSVPADAPAGEYVVLTLSDTGVGMSEETRARVFEPFFTTKPVGGGVGLGLAVVYGIVNQCGGFISCTSRPGEGTSFKMMFPRAEAAPGEQCEEDGPAAAAGGFGTILVVEDEDGVRNVTEKYLARAGYQVVVARDGTEAIAAAHDSEPAVLITDVVMPGTNGAELAETLSRMHPGMGVIFMSGYAQEKIAGGETQGGGLFFLQKPFDGAALLAKVREAMDARAGSTGGLSG